MNHVNLTFHLATRRLIYQNSFFFFFFSPHLLPIVAVGSTVKALRGWTGSGSGLISELCQDRAGTPSISPPGWSLYREIVSITQHRRFLPLLAWLVPLCALQLQPHKRLPKASPSVPTWLDPESHTAPCHGKTPGEPPRWGQTLILSEILSPAGSVYPPWAASPCPLCLGQS